MAIQNIGDVKLYTGEVNPNDVRLQDITTATGVWASSLGEAEFISSVGLSIVDPVTGDWASDLGDATSDIVAAEVFTGDWISDLEDATPTIVGHIGALGQWASTLQDAHSLLLYSATAYFIGTVEMLDRDEKRTQREQEIDNAQFLADRAERMARRQAKAAGRLTGL